MMLSTSVTLAQSDPLIGVWEFQQHALNEELHVQTTLSVGQPERGLLYPAQIQLKYASFTGSYRFLLVKRADGKWAIGRNKIPENESPFEIGAWMVFLNGYLNLQQNDTVSFLEIERFPSKKYGVPMPAIKNFNPEQQTTALRIKEFLQQAPIRWKKISNEPWMGNRREEIIHPYLSENYYGIMDSIHVNSRDGILRISDNTKKDDDSVSVKLNHRVVMDKWHLSDHTPMEIQLDTGLNILSFFAENYGNIPPNSGSLQVKIGKEDFKILYSNKADISSTVIVCKIYYYPPPPPPILTDKMKEGLLRTVKSKDSLTTRNSEITLAIWDDAVQDGDSISLFVNGEWLVQGMLVTLQPQFLKLKLKPGPNDIVFMADNLGAISPNTSILEIIDNKRRKAFYINTNLRENNLVRITYIPVDTE